MQLQGETLMAYADSGPDAVPNQAEVSPHAAGQRARNAGQSGSLSHTVLRSWQTLGVVVLSALAGLWLSRWLISPPVSPIGLADGRMVAGGMLAAALSEQGRGIEAVQSPVIIGLSYRAKGGSYCRLFTIKQGESIAGIACREPDGWHLQVLAQTGPKSPLAQYRMAGTLVPPFLMSVVESTIDGNPLDAAAEHTARQRSWRP
jgi:hypothetical protein